MAGEVWLHIGTPKSGTSSVQRYFDTHREDLAAQGLDYLSVEGRSNANQLAIAMNRKRDGLAALCEGLNAEIASSVDRKALISSEMFYGVDPAALLGRLSALRERQLVILVYLRRQDRYIEASYLQKSKNGRFHGSIEEYIARFDGSGSDYAAKLAPWAALPGARVVPRLLEAPQLTGGSVVSDALSLLGLPHDDLGDVEEANVSPGIHRVQLLQVAQKVGLANPRRLQRTLAREFPQDRAARRPILSQAERRAFVARYDASNEALRRRYFPDQDALFDLTDLDETDRDEGIAPFTAAQLEEVERLLSVVKSMR